MADKQTPNKVDQLKKGDVPGKIIEKAGELSDNRMVEGHGHAKDILKNEEE